MDKVRPPAVVQKTASLDQARQPQQSLVRIQRLITLDNLANILTGLCALVAAGATALDLGIAQLLERQAQTWFFELRGPVAAPTDIVILTIDDDSLAQGQNAIADPEKLSYLQPLQTWPWPRSVYATVIDKLMAAGAKTIVLDVLFDTPSRYGGTDDLQLEQVMQRYVGRVVLAAKYGDARNRHGGLAQLLQPLSRFRPSPLSIGSINFLIEPNGRVHQLGEYFFPRWIQNQPAVATSLDQLLDQVPPTLAAAALQAAKITYPEPKGTDIFFYGPAETFDQVPFWHVLDPANWEEGYLQSGAYFRDKIVLIGSTARLHHDFHAAPFSKTLFYPEALSGVEIQANAIATLRSEKSITPAISRASQRGLIILLGVAIAGWLLNQSRQSLSRFAWAGGMAIVWFGAGYVMFVEARLVLPTAVPIMAIVLSGLSHLAVGSAREQTKKQQLRNTLKHYATSPIVQEIISQQDDLKDLLQEREAALFGNILGGRYKIVRVLGSGGFSETYVAADIQRPSNPNCVVKRLRLVSDDLDMLKLARRMFSTEAETLERLSEHEQIPQLLAYFEEDNEFYLVQELIIGHPLSNELLPNRPLPEAKVLAILRDLLHVLQFVHGQGVIHRDIKPSNIIRRASDGKLILIDFGIVKQISDQLAENDQTTRFTVGVGTQGYMPSEQSAGIPHFCSDLYSLGVTVIEALTGLAPHLLKRETDTGELIWMEQAPKINPVLSSVLNKMVFYDFKKRYQSAQEILDALAIIMPPLTADMPPKLEQFEQGSTENLNEPVEEADSDAPTILWPETWPDP
ncbi:MAG: CHASE2 domain-containing protein [Cyanothece sp. SIO1E1]|nr:CHASE2 domain-containing protein [Cyanothece sp. SIO1E1]